MLNDALTKAAKSVSDAIRQTDEHKAYIEQKKLVRSNLETKKLIERARFIQEKLMEIPENDRNSDYAESIQNEYEEITENTSVYDYLRAEAVYMTMIQEVLGNIIETVDIDI